MISIPICKMGKLSQEARELLRVTQLLSGRATFHLCCLRWGALPLSKAFGSSQVVTPGVRGLRGCGQASWPEGRRESVIGVGFLNRASL